ncbi:hypothetical protein MMC29_000542 [Sticta canariensis]|nr:hypothetical protein [Sticta canariensis]
MEIPDTNLSVRSIASLNPFRKKLSSRRPLSTKPYEVFPGIWNTDATPKVFGCLDSNKPPLPNSTDERPIQRQRSNRRTHLQSTTWARKLLHRFREVYTDHGTDDFSGRTHRQCVEGWDRLSQKRHDEANQEREASQRTAMRSRMKMVSRDDELMQRGANPRTGVVSPELVADNMEESVRDGQIAAEHRKELKEGKKDMGGKWKQNDLGWSLIESPSFGPSADDLRKEPGHALLVDKLQDQFVVMMPGVDNSVPAEITSTQIQQYEERFRDVYKSGRVNHAEAGPRLWMPEGPRNGVQNIPRKEVGSGHAQRNGSTDTVIAQDRIRASSLSTSRKDSVRDRRVRIVTPLSTPTSNSPQCSLVDHDDRGFNSGLYPENLPNQRTDSIKRFSFPKMYHGIDPLSEVKSPNTPKAPVAPSSTPLPPRGYVPHLDFLHPSQFSSLTTSYHRPKEIQPARSRSDKIVENTGRGNDGSPDRISGQGLRIEEKGQIGVQNYATEILRASLPNSEQERRREHCVHGTQPAISSYSSTTPNASKPALKVNDDRIYKNRIVPDALGIDVGDGRRMDKKERDAGKQLEECSAAASCSCTRCDYSPSSVAVGIVTTKKGPSARSANITRNPLQNRAGCIHVDKNKEETSGGISAAKMRSTIGTQTQSSKMSPYQNFEGHPQLDISGNERLIGHRATGLDYDKHDEENREGCIEGLVHDGSNPGIVIELWRLIALAEEKFYDSIGMRSIQGRLTEMIYHIFRTLHTSSPALEVLRMPNANMREYLAALKDVILAIFYLWILLNTVIVIGKVLRLAAVAINLVWFPLKIVLLVARWFISG